jgi:diguanylate cyclase (GGDEF)-like protein
MARLQLVRQSARHYHALANFDPLTALSNRTRFQESLEESVLEADRTGERFALLFIDLDHFKDINDTLGHQWGDKLLQQVALRLKERHTQRGHGVQAGGRRVHGHFARHE